MLKVDIFLKNDNPYGREVFKRKRKETLDEERESVEFYFASCEDIILNKLKWFTIGGEVSERQWHDVLGVIKVQGDLLDKKYLYHWAEELGVFELLKKAYGEVENVL